jgi:hypothetical protein
MQDLQIPADMEAFFRSGRELQVDASDLEVGSFILQKIAGENLPGTHCVGVVRADESRFAFPKATCSRSRERGKPEQGMFSLVDDCLFCAWANLC